MYIIENNEEIHITDSKKIIKRNIALDIIENHGFTSYGLTAIDTNGNYVAGTSFDSEVGKKDFYTAKEIYSWLGY